MSLEHKRIERFQNEYMCLHCGKSWDVNDLEPPSCSAEPANSMRVAVGATVKQFNESFTAIGHAFTNYGDRPVTNVAWLVTDTTDTEAPATLIYADSRDAALKYITAVTRVMVGLEVSRLKAMDTHAFGMAPYFELNPLKLRVAANASRRQVIPLLKFLEINR